MCTCIWILCVCVFLSKCILAFHIAYSTAVGQVADDVKSSTQMRLLLINTVLQESARQVSHVVECFKQIGCNSDPPPQRIR